MLTALSIIRRAKDMSQWKLGISVGQTESQMCLLEAGRRKPSKDLALKFADRLGVDVKVLFPKTGGRK